jgi:PUA domain protein
LHRFTQEENVSGVSLLKSSAQKAVRKQILEQYPTLEPHVEELLPKATQMYSAKWYLYYTNFNTQ